MTALVEVQRYLRALCEMPAVPTDAELAAAYEQKARAFRAVAAAARAESDGLERAVCLRWAAEADEMAESLRHRVA